MNFQEIIRRSYTFNREEWNYYNINIQNLDIEDSQDCGKFIRDFFEIAEKGSLLNSKRAIDSLKAERRCHIVYVFLFGAEIYKTNYNFKNLIDREIAGYVEHFGCNSGTDFYYIWFLCCLYHDLGYVKEDSDKLVKLHFKEERPQIGVPNMFTISGIKNYWKYRQECVGQKKNDHGIYAGDKMYKSLCRIRKKHENDKNGTSCLCWVKSLESIYSLASWIVMCHNIWFAQENETEKCENYKKYGLEQFILKEGDCKIRKEDHPLFFFFCLIDTVEPMKKMKDFSLLEGIDISFEANKIIITDYIGSDQSEEYLGALSGLDTWLAKTNRNGNKVTIDLS